MKKTRFLEPETVTAFPGKERRQSFGNNRALNPSVSGTGTELDSPCSLRARDFTSNLDKRFLQSSFGGSCHDIGVPKTATTKFSSSVKTPKLASVKIASTPRIETVPSKISNPGSTRELVSLLLPFFNYIIEVLSFN